MIPVGVVVVGLVLLLVLLLELLLVSMKPSACLTHWGSSDTSSVVQFHDLVS